MKSCPKCLNLAPETAVACEYCGTVLDDSVLPRATQALRRGDTVVEPQPTSRPVPPSAIPRPSPPPPSPSAPPPPPSAAPAGTGRRGETLYVPPAEQRTSAPPPPTPSAGRRVLGILVTYSWRPEGQVFPVREGRNLIGRGEECDIRVPEDPTLSQVNSHITFRRSFVVGDMVSMGGTYLDDEPVEEQFRPMANYSRIRTGSTHWFFVVIDPNLVGHAALSSE